MNAITKRQQATEPEWKQNEEAMLACLDNITRGPYDEWSASNWALWQIANLRKRVNELGAYADELEAKVDGH